MKIKKGQEEKYSKYVEINSTDGYSYGVVKFGLKWANLMEECFEQNKDKDIKTLIIENAERLGNKADTEGITGFMYSAAISALSEFWEHGEELRKWHNKEYGYEGDGIVNPAILTIKE